MHIRWIIIICLPLIVLIYFNNFLAKKFVRQNPLRQSIRKTLAPTKTLKAQKQPEPKKKRYTHKPANPADFGIEVLRSENRPRSLDQWEGYYRNILEKNKVLEHENAEKAFELTYTDEEDYDEKMKVLDEQIKAQEKIRDDNPLDSKAGKKLQKLYKLKAIGRIIKNRVVRDDVNIPKHYSDTIDALQSP